MPRRFRRARRRRAPRPALHDARAGSAAGGRDRARPHLLRPSRVARADQGAVLPAGHRGGRPARRRGDLRERSHRRALRRACAGRAAPVVVAPHGVDHDAVRRRRAGSRRRRRGAGAARARRRSVRSWSSWARSSRARASAVLIEAFDRVADRHPDAVLVLAGQPGWGDQLASLDAAAHRSRILVTGYVPDDAVPALLRRAAAAAYPSLGEGFGHAGPRGARLRDPARHDRRAPRWPTRPATPRWSSRRATLRPSAPRSTRSSRAIPAPRRGGEPGWPGWPRLPGTRAAERHVEAYRIAASGG